MIPSQLVDQSHLISLLLRRGSRAVGGASAEAGDLYLDRYYQTVLPSPGTSNKSALYGLSPTPSSGPWLRARDTQIPLVTARTPEELHAHVNAVQARSDSGMLLYRQR